jgi:hypothetical protein
VQLIYTNNIEDLIALNVDMVKNNAQFKKRKYWGLYVTPLLLLFAFSFIAYITDKPSFYVGAVVGSLFSFLWTFFAYKNYPKKAAKQTQQKEVMCEHTLTVTEYGVRESTQNSESYHKWEAIDNISTNANYVFIYNTPMTAHVIPKRVVGEKDFVKIKEKISMYQSPSKALE